jgi:hypothetical protein
VTFLGNDSDMPVCLSSRNKDFLGDDCSLAPNSSRSYSVIAFLSRVLSSNGISKILEILSHALNCFRVWNQHIKELPSEFTTKLHFCNLKFSARCLLQTLCFLAH